MEIIGSGTYGCVYFPGFNCKGKKQNKNNKNVSKITNDEIGALSEYNAGILIKKNLKNYNDYFLVVEKKCDIYKGNLNKYIKNTCELVNDNNKKYNILYSKYVDGYDLLDFYKLDLSKPNNINNFFTNYFIYSENLLKAVSYLEDLNIVHFDISLKNIRISKDNNKAIIIDFGLSILMQKVIKNIDNYGNVLDFNINELYKYFSINPIESPKYCFEIQIICFILHNYKNFDLILRDSDFKEFIKKYYNSNGLFFLFSENFKDKYIVNLYEKYSKYIGKPVKNIICACLTTWRTWDSFNLHFHFISLLYNLNEFHEIIIKLISLSMRQIHSDPNKRLSNDKVIDIYYKIINNENSKTIIDFKSSMQKANIEDIKSNFVSSYKILYSEIIY